MEGPEIEAGNGVVIARIAQVQESQQMLVDEVEPEEPAIGAGFAVHRQIEIGRITQSRQYVPGSSDEQQKRHPRHWTQPTPVALGKEDVKRACGDGKQRG